MLTIAVTTIRNPENTDHDFYLWTHHGDGTLYPIKGCTTAAVMVETPGKTLQTVLITPETPAFSFDNDAEKEEFITNQQRNLRNWRASFAVGSH